MILDRDENGNGKGKYALVKLREIDISYAPFGQRHDALINELRKKPEALDYGLEGSDSEFFVIRLKDKYAAPALKAYAKAAMDDDLAWGMSVQLLAEKAKSHPGKKRPD